MSDPISGLMRGQIDLERRIGQTEVREVPFYATGTYTPEFGGTTTDGTMTYDVQQGRYTRIGNLCIARLRINTATVTAVPTGSLQITLPLTVANVGGTGCPLEAFSMLNLTAGYTFVGVRFIANTARATLTQSGDNVATIFVPGSAMSGADVEIIGTLIYEVA